MGKYHSAFGERLKELRRQQGLTLRDFCRENGFDHGNMSRIERGLARPPVGERLDKYLSALGIEKETDVWYEMHDLASTCAGEIPSDIMSEEQIVKKLPAIFRTMGREKPTEEQLDKLVALVKKEMAGE